MDDRQELESLIKSYQSIQLDERAKGNLRGALFDHGMILSLVSQLHGEKSRQYLQSLQTQARYETQCTLYDDAIQTYNRILENEDDFVAKQTEQVGKTEEDLRQNVTSDEDDEDEDETSFFKEVRRELADAQKCAEYYAEAESNYKQLLEAIDPANEGYVPTVLIKLSLAEICAYCGRDNEAIKFVDEAIDVISKELDGNTYLLNDAQNVRANIYYIQGDFQQLLEVRQQVYDKTLEAKGPEDLTTQNAQVSLAQAWVLNDREEEAREILATPVYAVIPSMTQDEPKRIEEFWYKALSTPNPDGTGYGDMEQMKKLLLKVRGRDTSPYQGLAGAEGRGMLRDVMRVFHKHSVLDSYFHEIRSACSDSALKHGEEHIITSQLGEMHTKAFMYITGVIGESVEKLQRIRDIYEEICGPKSYRTVQCDAFLKSFLDDEGQLDEDKAIDVFQNAWKQKVQDQGASSHSAYAANITTVKVLDGFGRVEDAQAQLQKCVLAPMTDLKMAKRALDIAPLFQVYNLNSETQNLYFEALPLFEAEQGVVSAEVFSTGLLLGRLFEDTQQPDKAIDLYKSMIDRAAILMGTEGIDIANVSQAWKTLNISRGIDEEESSRILAEYIKENHDRWKKARKSNLVSFKPLLPNLEGS